MSISDLLQTVTKAAKTFRQKWRRGLSNVQCPWDREGCVGGGGGVGVRWLDGADTADYNVPTLLIWVSFSLSNIKISKSPKVHLWFSQNWNRQKKTSTETIIFLHWLPWRWAQRWLYCQQELIYISLPTFIITPQVTESKLIIAPRVNQFGKKGQTRFWFALLIK